MASNTEAITQPQSPLEVLVNEVRDLFIAAKADGKLDAGEVVQIASAAAVKVQRLARGAIRGAEKKALVLLALKKGLEAAGGVRTLPGFAELGEEAAKGLEGQLLAAAAAALDVAVAAAAGRLDLHRREGLLACLGACLSAGQAVAAVALKDQPLLKEAVEFAAEQGKAALVVAKAPESRAPESANPESVAPVSPPSAAPEQDTTPPSQSQTEPSLPASAVEAPAPVEVKFD